MGWVVNATPRPLYSRERDPVPIVLEAWWAPNQSGRVRKTSPPLTFDPSSVHTVVSRYTKDAVPGLLCGTNRIFKYNSR